MLASYLTCMLLLTGAVHALDPEKRVTQYQHTSWRIQDGSAPDGMFSITQTSDGFLWFLSLPGEIYRFDGVRFLPWRLPPSPSFNTIGKVFADHTGGLWVVGDELVHLKDGVVISHFALENGSFQVFQSISEDPDGSLWIMRRHSDAPLCHVTDRGVKCFGKDDGIPISSLSTLLADGIGGFWLGGEAALVHWHAGVSETYKVGKAEVSSLARGPDGSLWVGTRGQGLGLGLLKEGAVKPFVTPTFDGSTAEVTSMMFDRDGNLWVGTDAKGLFRIHENAVEHYGHTEGLSGDSVWALLEDREGIVWAGTTSGIDSFRDPRVTTFSASEGLGKDLAAGILASRDGTIWVANDESLDHIKNGIVSSIRKIDGLPGDQVASLLEDHAGILWVGVDDRLYLFKDGRFRRLPEPDHQPLGMVVGMTEDIDGNTWAECASRPRKLVRIRDFQVREVFPESQVPRGHNLAPDPHGGIWVETLDGDMVLFRNGKLETTVPLYRGSSPLNRQIVAQADGSVLAGTENGLLGWRNGKVQRMTTKNGLPCDFIITFIEDKEKRWWLYTRCGVVEFSDSELQRWWAKPDAIIQDHVYDTFDGAQPNIGSFNAAATTADGRVWFSSGVDVQMVDPSSLSKKAPPAMTYVESVVVDRKEFQATDNLKLSPHPRDLQIDYTSPTFTVPQRVKFRYRLDNYDRDWHDAGTRRQAFYTDLPPGKYSFRVIACNSDGVWNDSAAKLDFSVAPAYYQTNWFRTLCAASFLALLWALYRLRMQQLRRQERKLRDVIETIPTFAWTALPNGLVDFGNHHWQQYTGLSTEKTVGSGWQAAVHPKDLGRYAEKWRASLATGDPFENEERFRRAADGKYRWFLTRAVPLRDQRGNILKWYGVSTDIEDRKLAEQLRADLAHITRVTTMGELIASLAHEINQPIAASIMNAKTCLRWLTREQPDLDEGREAAKRIVKDGTRAAEIIDNIRSMYKKSPPQRELVDVNDIIREMVALLRGEGTRYGVSIRTELAADVPKITADRVQLQQVLMNLMLNGIEAMKDTGGVLTIKSQRDQNGGLLISVSDTGVGLPAEKADQIFDAFFTTKPQGSGMGLSISRSILESHGGRLWATANSGRGATFHFTLQATLPSTSAPDEVSSSGP